MSILRAVVMTCTAVAVSTGAISPAVAQPDVSAQDRRFLSQAHQGNLTEIAAGTTAREKGQASVVRSLGALLVTDHTKLDTAVKNAAQRLRVSLPGSPTPEQHAEHGRLTMMTGSAFDRAWLEAMIKSHRMALAAGEQEVRAGSAPEAKQVATSSAPVIRGHLEQLMLARKTVQG